MEEETLTRNDSLEVLSRELSSLEIQHLKRALHPIEQTEGTRLIVHGRSLLNFSSNNYLGLARHPRVIEAVKQVLDHWGAGATSSRLIGGTSIIHQDLECALASFVKKEAALVFPSGYMANLGVVTALVGEGDAVILDRLCHASLIDAARLSRARVFVYRHADPEDAERALKRAKAYRRRLLATDSLFSMDGDFAPLSELAELCRRYEAISLVDEAHAVGVWGEGGRGIRHLKPQTPNGPSSNIPSPLAGEGGLPANASVVGGEGGPPHWDIVIGTLSKALGSQGGFVAGSQEMIETLINKARSFIYTTGLSPACVSAAHAAFSVIQEDSGPRLSLHRLAKKLREALSAKKFSILNSESQIIPIFLGDVEIALSFAANLQAHGIYAPAIRPPTVAAGECRIRFSLTADHTEEDVERLLEVLRKTKL